MIELAKYSLRDYIRSHKYFLPIAMYIILIVLFYTYTPNPIIDSYAVTALFLYIISSWLAISVLALDDPVQTQIIILHMQSRTRYYLSKLLTTFMIGLGLSLFAFVYPIVFQMFSESVSIQIGFISFINHLLLSLLGLSVGSLFSRNLMSSPINSYGGLALTLTISISAIGIYSILPHTIRNIVWIIPPSVITQLPLMNWSGESILELSTFPFIWIMLYSFIAIFIFIRLSNSKSL
ncbi:hypothetical protein D8M04_03020 [Oceanobacillus piezotolerans]|uniref:ABC transporter permease n=1 Tax=Oceanobacillus piezotolerans TaxID=2448030 RepID=A0A498DB83_9BACI|nr:hypothetical protein [Oceanobacillus piezotolerans]RLL48261.1 hypothetical protein D8M04_03020 [Oceanobacillus piezotolerans]